MNRGGHVLLARAVTVPVVVLAALGLAGCRGAEPTALPTSAARSEPAPAPPADPLAGVESAVDAVERAVDTDVGPAAGR